MLDGPEVLFTVVTLVYCWLELKATTNFQLSLKGLDLPLINARLE